MPGDAAERQQLMTGADLKIRCDIREGRDQAIQLFQRTGRGGEGHKAFQGNDKQVQ